MRKENNMSFEELFVNDWTNFCKRFDKISGAPFKKEKAKKTQSLFKEMHEKMWYTPGSLSSKEQGEILKSTIATDNKGLMKKLLERFPNIIKDNKKNIDIEYCVRFKDPKILQIITNECGKKYIVKSLAETNIINDIIFPENTALLNTSINTLKNLYQNDLLADVLNIWAKEEEIFGTKEKKTIADILNEVCDTYYVDESVVEQVIKPFISKINERFDDYYSADINEILAEILNEAQADDYYNAAIDNTLVEVLAEVPVDSNSGE